MCLGVPGKVIEKSDEARGTSGSSSPCALTMGKVSFGGVVKEVCLSYLPDVEVGDWVIVHVGFAISKIDETEARRVFESLAEIGELETPLPEPADPVAGAS